MVWYFGFILRVLCVGISVFPGVVIPWFFGFWAFLVNLAVDLLLT